MLKLYLSSSFKATGACSWEFKLCKIGCLPQQSSLILTLKLGMKIFYAEFNSVINLHTAYSEKKLEMSVMGPRLNDVVDGGSSLLWRHHRQFTFTIFFGFIYLLIFAYFWGHCFVTMCGSLYFFTWMYEEKSDVALFDWRV